MKNALRLLVPLLAFSFISSAPASRTEVASAPAADAVFVSAIREQRLISFTYGGHPRTVEPHAYGVATTGDVVLHGYQIAGGSASGKPPGWRTFNTAEIRELTVTETNFTRMRADYSAERPKLDPLWAEVAATEAKVEAPATASAP